MTTPRITASAPVPPLPPTPDKTFKIEAERWLKECEERLERFASGCTPIEVSDENEGSVVPAAEYGVMTATPGQRLRVAVVHRVEEILAEAAPVPRWLRTFRAG